MVVIRLSRGGAKKRPFYHMVATDSRARRDGKYLELLGYFNPIARGQELRLNLKMDRIVYWQSQGAQLSDRVRSLLKEYSKTVGTSATPVVEKKSAAVEKNASNAETDNA